MTADPGLAGRTAEVEHLGRALQAAASGVPCALVAHCEAGVGKTHLVRETCRVSGLRVLWGSCVRFGSASVPFAPIAGAPRDWLDQAEPTERDQVLAGLDDLSSLLPQLGGAETSDTGRLIPLVDLLLNRIAAATPTVLVVDDLQWADMASLDVLAYLIAGFRDQRLAVVTTCRDEDRGEGHPLHGWLADLRRMPFFEELRLKRLDLEDTGTQIANLLHRPKDLELAARVQELSDGNPYLTELLIRDLPSPQAFPATVPDALRETLLSTWHRLSDESRQLTRILAVSGRPTPVALLRRVAAEHGVDANRVTGCLVEAEVGGVIQSAPDGSPWFRHPLLAEVLYDDVWAAPIHATYVRVLE
ncbi:AAA family ATPase [Kribbella sp. NPDC026596]|uniref:ATP-binding protein n=1 Tax=Kribbella sp. NPDC026596 TaxID=3155122 RepID=UPI003411B0B6